MHPLTLKYLPKTEKDIIGQDESLKKIKDYLLNYKKQKKKAILLYGPTGTGKTSAVHAIASDLNLELIEVNASDQRNADQIKSVIGASSKQLSLFAKSKLILVDEADGISGNADRGGMPALLEVIENSAFPIILTMANPWDYSYNNLRKKTEMIEFAPLAPDSIFAILKKICDKEKIKYEDDVLRGLARRSGNDARAAINDLETLSIVTKSLTKESLEKIGVRNKLDSMPQALVKIFKTTDPNVAITAFDTVEEDVDKQFLWIEENIPREYTTARDCAVAFDRLSKADVFRRRIRRWQHWRFLIYINALISAGVATAKEEKYKQFVEYKPTGRLLKLWWANQKNMKKKAIAEKIASKIHSSKKTTVRDTIPYLKIIAKHDAKMRNKMAEEFELSEEEVTWLITK